MSDAWYARLAHLGRFVSTGAVHKAVDIIEAVTVAVMAFSLATSSAEYLDATVCRSTMFLFLRIT